MEIIVGCSTSNINVYVQTELLKIQKPVQMMSDIVII